MSVVNRRKVASLLCLIVLVVFIPPALVGWFLRGVGLVIGGAGSGISWLALAAYQPCERFIEKKFGVDPEADHEAWRMRMYEKRLAREKVNDDGAETFT